MRLIQLAAWSLLAFIIFATISPIALRPSDPLPVDIDRALAFALLGASFTLAYPKTWKIVVAACVIGTFASEALQFLSPSRHAHLMDAGVKASGALVGSILGLGFNVMRRRA